MAIRVDAAVYTAPISLLEKVEGVKAELESAGWSVKSDGVGSGDGIFPQWIPAHFVVDRPGATVDAASAAVKDAAGGGWFTAWKDFKASFVTEVVTTSAKDFANGVQGAGKAVQDAAGGIGIGIGMLMVAICIGGGAFLAFKYSRA